MNLNFFKKKLQYLALDIGDHSIKMLLFEKHQALVKNILIEPTPEGCVAGGNIINEDKLSSALIRCVESLQIDSAFRVITHLSGIGILAKKINLPAMEASTITDCIELIAEGELLYEKEHMELDYNLLKDMNFQNPEHHSVFATRVLKKDIENYNSLMEKSFMTCTVLDSAFAALFNSLKYNNQFDKDKVYMILDIGHQSTLLLMVVNAQIIFSRIINFAGFNMTEEIQKEMNIDAKQAEALKASANKEGETPEQLISFLNKTLNPQLCGAISSNYNMYLTIIADESPELAQRNIDSIYITGGTCASVGLIDALQKEFSSPVKIFDPFANIDLGDFASEKNKFKNTSTIITGLMARMLDD